MTTARDRTTLIASSFTAGIEAFSDSSRFLETESPAEGFAEPLRWAFSARTGPPTGTRSQTSGALRRGTADVGRLSIFHYLSMARAYVKEYRREIEGEPRVVSHTV